MWMIYKFYILGQLKILVNHLTQPGAPIVPSGVLHKIQQLQVKADQISDVTTPYIRANQPTYYQR